MILILAIDLNLVGSKYFILDDNVKFLFIKSQIHYNSSGIYSISIKIDNKGDIVKAFEIFRRKSDIPRINEILTYIKDVSLSQANLENIFMDLCNKYK